MAKATPKKQRKAKPAGGETRAAAKRAFAARVLSTMKGRRKVELKAKEPKTVQKTVRVPTVILGALEDEAGKVSKLTVPGAIVQILEDWYRKREGAARSA